MKITNTQLQQIIKEEAIRLKTRMMLENEKATILKKLQEIEECDTMEEGIFDKTDYAAEADKLLALPAYKKAAEKAVLAFFKMGPAALGDWAKHFFDGKNVKDNAQANEIYNNMIGSYKNLFKMAYIANKGNMRNMSFNPATGTFEKSDMGSGLGFGFGTQYEGKQPK